MIAPTLLAQPRVDGVFDEWQNGDAHCTDERPGDAPDYVDLGPVCWRLDANGLWLRIRTAAATNIAQSRRTLSLLVDSEPGGLSYRGAADVDLVIEYSPPTADSRRGFRQLKPANQAWQPAQVGDGYYRSAPTVMAADYELLARSSSLVAGSRVQIQLWSDQGADASAWIELQPSADAAVEQPALTRHSDTDLRVMVWNTGGERATRQNRRFDALLKAVSPDVALLDEVHPKQTVRDVAGLRHHSMGSTGGRQRGLILSRWPLQAVPAFEFLDYPPGTDDWIQRAGSEFMRRDLKTMMSDGAPAHGALLDHRGWRILLVALDLQCCGDGEGSVQDQLRMIQVQRIAQAIEAVRASTGFDELLIGGDFNLVGQVAPLNLARGVVAPALTVAAATQPDGLSNVTWIRNDNEFPPGRLDYLLFSSGWEQLSGVVFNPAVMTRQQLKQLQLTASTTDRMSGHQPVVVDLRRTGPAETQVRYQVR